MTTIPDNNLPIYLQKYTVNILNTPLSKCQPVDCGQFGCCPDTNTPKIDPEGSNCELIGGCSGTEYGCCPYSSVAKSDPSGSNCENVAGSTLYSTVSALPTNKEGKRLWNLKLTGYLKPGVSKYYIVYNFSNVDYKDEVTFEDITSGTFTVCGNVMDASKMIGNNYEYCNLTSTVTFVIDTSRWGFHLKKNVLFSYDILLNDCTSPCESSKTSTSSINNQLYINNIPTWASADSYQLENGSTVILIVQNTIGLGITNNNGQPEYEGYYYNSCNWHKIDYPEYTPSSLPSSGAVTVTLKNNGFFCGESSSIPIIYYNDGDTLYISPED